MKKATIQLKYDEEKLTALEKYMKKKEADLETELQQTLQKLYEKYVPPAVREYIESRETGEGKTGTRSTERRNSGWIQRKKHGTRKVDRRTIFAQMVLNSIRD